MCGNPVFQVAGFTKVKLLSACGSKLVSSILKTVTSSFLIDKDDASVCVKCSITVLLSQ